MADRDEAGREVPGRDEADREVPDHHDPDVKRVVVPAHLGADRFGKIALRAAHDISAALAAAGVDDDGAVLLRTDGPRQSLAQTEALLDAALAETLEEDRQRAADDRPTPDRP